MVLAVLGGIAIAIILLVMALTRKTKRPEK